ncbi:MAG: cysteine--tRNA ligase [Nitrospirae bacterium]|nr:cysteine--tRNA ligase [Nitrospirota bacterium]
MGLLAEIKRDYRAVLERDPAARSALEVLLTYSGFHAVFMYRINHRLLKCGIPFFPRFFSQLARFITGVEIHPAAKIAPGLFIDHGMGVVIGETAEVGKNCLLYQGVTLGGTGKEQGKRHPTLGDYVTVGTGAKVLGSITIGDYVTIGANAVVLQPVPPHSVVVGVPGKVVKKKIVRMGDEGPVEVDDRVCSVDPLEERCRIMESKIAELQDKLERIERGGEARKADSLRIYNTLTGKKEPFVPITPGRVGMYVCGITVYDNCHIGHARSAIVFDVMRRYLAHRGYKVTYVRNFTDVDDKIINRANKEGVAWDEIARRYTEAFYDDMNRLGVRAADVEPKATDYIDEMIEIVAGLIEKGHAYAVGGDVYFATRTFEGYGKLSKRDLDELMSGARVEVNEIKRDPLDFALWKSSKPGEPAWESPWGPGRPGWHIECSAMSRKHLGDSFDIHGGGADLIFPHHENEIAQSEAFTGKPFVRYWVHNGFITVDKEKMSKSLGNFFTIKEILDKFDPEAVRFFILSTHYRSPIEFSDEQLREAEVSLDRYYTTSGRIVEFLEAAPAGEKKSPGEQAIDDLLSEFNERFSAAMDDDFNTAQATGLIFELVREANRYLDAKPVGSAAMERVKRARDLVNSAGRVMGLFKRTPHEWNLAILASRRIGLDEAAICAKIEERRAARERKDWGAADAVRNELAAAGVLLEDKKDRTGWKVKV